VDDTIADNRGSDALQVLEWGVRRYPWVLVLSIVVCAGLLPLVSILQRPTYAATSLVVARSAEVDLAALPRYGQAVFDDGTVARQVGQVLGVSSTDVVPSIASVEAIQDSVVFRVVGRSGSPERAARISNVAARAFVRRLNVPGAGVGDFIIQSKASRPNKPEPAVPGLPYSPLLGGAAGVFIGVGVIGLMLLVTRPVIDGVSAAALAGVPLLATLKVRRPEGESSIGREDVAGLAYLGRQLRAIGSDAVFLVDPPGWPGLATPLARLLGADERARATQDGPASGAPSRPPVAGSDEPGLPRAVILANEGERARAILGTFTDYPTAAGVVFVRLRAS